MKDYAFKVWSISYQLFFRKTLGGEGSWRTSPGRLASMTQRIIRAERNEHGDLWQKILEAHERHCELEQSAASRRAARDAGTETSRRIKSAKRFEQKEL